MLTQDAEFTTEQIPAAGSWISSKTNAAGPTIHVSLMTVFFTRHGGRSLSQTALEAAAGKALRASLQQIKQALVVVLGAPTAVACLQEPTAEAPCALFYRNLLAISASCTCSQVSTLNSWLKTASTARTDHAA